MNRPLFFNTGALFFMIIGLLFSNPLLAKKITRPMLAHNLNYDSEEWSYEKSVTRNVSLEIMRSKKIRGLYGFMQSDVLPFTGKEKVAKKAYCDRVKRIIGKNGKVSSLKGKTALCKMRQLSADKVTTQYYFGTTQGFKTKRGPQSKILKVDSLSFTFPRKDIVAAQKTIAQFLKKIRKR